MDLEELQNQRKLVAKHLAWLDHQIADQANQQVPAPTKTETAETAEAGTATPLNPIGLPAPAPLLGQKLGCIAVFAIALLLFLGLLFIVPHFLYR